MGKRTSWLTSASSFLDTGVEKREERAGGIGDGGFRTDLIAELLIKHQISGIRIELMSHKS